MGSLEASGLRAVAGRHTLFLPVGHVEAMPERLLSALMVRARIRWVPRATFVRRGNPAGFVAAMAVASLFLVMGAPPTAAQSCPPGMVRSNGICCSWQAVQSGHCGISAGGCGRG